MTVFVAWLAHRGSKNCPIFIRDLLELRANLKQHLHGDLVQSRAAVLYPSRFRFKGDEIAPYPYQLDCLPAADATLAAGCRRMLFETARGPG